MKSGNILKKYWNRKYIRVGVITLGVLVVLMISVPYLFKDTLYRKTQNTIGESMNAKVNFQSFKLSLFSDFPKLQIRLKELTISGAGEFKNDTLLYAKTVATNVSFIKVIFGGTITVHDLIFENPKIYLLVGEDGKVNWDYGKKTPKKKSKDSFGIRMDNIVVTNGNFIYEDKTTNMFVRLNSLSLKTKGSMYGAVTELKANAATSGITFIYQKDRYLQNIPLKLEAGIKINLDKQEYLFDQAKMSLKDIPLIVDGGFSMPNDTTFLNLGLKANGCKFGQLLALIPLQYQSKLKGAKTNGSADISGYAKGFYTKNSYPEFGMRVGVKNADLQFKGLPEKISHVNLNFVVNKTQGSLDNTVVKMNELSAVIGGNLLKMNLTLDHMVSDLHFKGNLAGRIDFASMKRAMPLDSMSVTGRMFGNIMAEGLMSSIRGKNYAKVKTQGYFNMNGFSLTSAKMSQKLIIRNATVVLNPNIMTLTTLNGNIGKSDFAMNGSIRDFYPYWFGKGTLSGVLNLRSSLFDLNQLMALSTSTGGKRTGVKEKTTTGGTSFKLPGRINFTFNALVARVLYNKFDLANVKGNLTLHDQAVDMKNMGFNIYGGQMLLSGRYAAVDKQNSSFVVNMDMKNLNIPQAYAGMHLFKNLIPLAEHSTGNFSTTLAMNGLLGPNMDVWMPSVNGTGNLSTKNVKISGAGIFNQVATVLKNDKWRNVNLSDFSVHYVIEKGNLIINPFKVKVSGQEVTVSGRKGVDDKLDFRLGMKLDRLAGGFNNLLSSIPQAQAVQNIDAGVLILGTVTKPIIKVDFSKAKGQIKQQVKQQVQSLVEQKVKEELNKKTNTKLQNAAKKLKDKLRLFQ